MTPEKTLLINAADSPTPSVRPIHTALAPSVVDIKSGKSAWIISEEISISRLTKPKTQTVRGMPESDCLFKRKR